MQAEHSDAATRAPGTAEGQVRTVKMLGSAWSTRTEFTGLNRLRSYRKGT